jgi:hypothetical protein
MGGFLKKAGFVVYLLLLDFIRGGITINRASSIEHLPRVQASVYMIKSPLPLLTIATRKQHERRRRRQVLKL